MRTPDRAPARRGRRRRGSIAALLAIAAWLAPSPARADSTVVFHEIMYHPPDREADLEWIELANQMAVDMDISGWYVAGGVFFPFPEGTIVPGGGFLVLASSPGALEAETGLSGAYGPFDGRLSNAGERLELRNNSDRIMDAVRYRDGGAWPVGADGSGASLAKMDPDAASGPAANWAASRQVGGTPGAPNFPAAEGAAASKEGLVSYWRLDDPLLGEGTYEEDFEEPDGPPADWMVAQAEAFVEAGALVLRAGQGAEPFAWAGQAGAPLSFGTIRSVSFRVAFVGRPGDTVGRHGGALLCCTEPTQRWSPGMSGYMIDWIDRASDHGYRIIKMTGGQHTAIAVGSPQADPGSEWRIAFEGDRFSLSVDGRLIGRYTDASYRGGYVGLWCYSNAGQEVRFDDVRIEYGSPAVDGADGNDGTPGPGATSVDGIVGTGALAFDNTPEAFLDVGPGRGDGFAATDGLTIEAIAAATWSGDASDEDVLFGKGDPEGPILLALRSGGSAAELDVPIAPADGPVLAFGLTVGGAYTELAMPLDGRGERPALADFQGGEAHHIAATYDRATGRKAIYVDGALRFLADLPAGGAIRSGGSAPAVVGNASGGDAPFTGVLDEVAFWRRALAAEEIAAHAAAFRAGKGYFAWVPPAAGPTPLAFNETSGTGAGEPWVEIVNHGAVPRPLAGYAIARSGALGAPHVLPDGTLPPGGYLVRTESDLGFPLTPGDALFLFAPDRGTLLAAARFEEGPRARRPDGTGRWLVPDGSTPGAPNRFALQDAIVIDEIMYHPMGEPDERGEYVEILNRGDAPVDLAGYRFGDGIAYEFPDGTSIGPGALLVIARDPDWIRAAYGVEGVLGPFEGRLENRGERIVLSDPLGNPADEVAYFDRGRWPEYADGGGSSLELRDPRADNTCPEAWAASDEGARSAWESYAYEGVARATPGPTRWNEFVLGLLDAGEVLLDDIHVIESPGGAAVELIRNPTFEAGAASWRLLGNHERSDVVPDPDDPGNEVLHLVATGATEHMHNHAETTLAGGRRVVNGRIYRIAFRARWLGGSRLLNTRLYFNRLARTTALAVPEARGTPGAPNSRLAPNIGPTFRDLRHEPVIPAPGEPVTVSIAAGDPDGVAACALWWSVQGGPWQSAPMAAGPDGRYAGTIPGQSAGRVVRFYAEAEDDLGASARFPAAGPEGGALFAVDDGQADLARVHNLRIIMAPADAAHLYERTNVMSNERLPTTVVYDEREVFYDVGVRLRGSERGRVTDQRIGYTVRFDPGHPFRGVHRSVSIDRSGGWAFGRSFGQDEIVVKHIINHAGGIPGMYDDIIRVIPPRRAHTGPALLLMARFGRIFLDSQFENGADGTTYTYELIYYPTTTVDGRPESLKLPQPDQVMGSDLRNLGDDKEIYRWFFLLENHRDRDDYGPIMGLCKAMSLPSAQLEAGVREVMDVDEWMRAFAVYSLCGIGDTYTQGNDHNNIYYERPSDGRVLVFPWDMDFAFVRSTSASLWGDRNLARVIALPANMRRFYRHLEDLIDTTFNRAYMERWIDHYGALCGQNFRSLLAYIAGRGNYVLSRLPRNVPFEITTHGGDDFETDGDRVEIRGTAPLALEAIERDGAPVAPRWRSATRWSVDVSLRPGPNTLAFLGRDATGAVIGSARITVTSTRDWNPPEVVFVTPEEGPESGGTEVRIFGENLAPGLRVRFGGVEAIALTYVNDGLVLAVSPPGRGTVPIEVENPDGTKAVAPTPFVYLAVGTPFVRGDASADGVLDLGDAIRILSYLFAQGGGIGCVDAADCDDDGVLTIGDPIALLSYLFTEGPPPAAPFPGCGVDPGPDDDLACDAFAACE